MDEELRALVAAQSAGNLNDAEFVERLLRFETERARANGLVLTASHTFDSWTIVTLRVCGAAAPLASFEFDPASGRFREAGTPCREPDPRAASPRLGTDLTKPAALLVTISEAV
jgi:hypothetical protein